VRRCWEYIYMYVYIYMYSIFFRMTTIHIHACMHACIHTYLPTYIHTYIHAYDVHTYVRFPAIWGSTRDQSSQSVRMLHPTSGDAIIDRLNSDRSTCMRLWTLSSHVKTSKEGFQYKATCFFWVGSNHSPGLDRERWSRKVNTLSGNMNFLCR